MYYTCEFCGLTFQAHHANRENIYCPYCRSTRLLEATPMEIMLTAMIPQEAMASFYPGLEEKENHAPEDFVA